MRIRKIEEKDADKFVLMLKTLDQETKNMIFEPGERQTTIDEMKSRIKQTYTSNSLTLIVEDDEQIIGFLSAIRGFANRNKHSAYLVIGLLSDYRGKGLGQQLFTELHNWALENHIKRLELTVMTHNENALSLYQKMGYEIEGVKKRSLIVDEKYVDEYYMAKLID